MIFLKSFSTLFRTGPLHQRRILSYHIAFLVSTAFFMLFEMALSGCGVSLWLVRRKGFPGFLIEGFPFFAFLTLSALPHTKKISRSARNDGAGRGYPGLHVLSIKKRRCEITIISFSRSICRGGLAALLGVTGKPYPSCLSCHSHPIRPCGAPSPRGEGCDTRIPSFKKGGEAAT